MTCYLTLTLKLLMKRSVVAALFFIALVAGSATRGQAPNATDDKQMLALVKDIQAQQAQIAENEAKIDAKLGEIGEILRVARIFTSREK